MRNAAVVLLAVGMVLAPGCRKSHPPDTPAVPVGPSSGAVGVEYTFSSSATDPDGDDVAIRFDWGDGDTSDWSPWVRPGDTVTMSHAWSAPGTFNVKAQAKAANSTFSNWSDRHPVGVGQTWTRTFGGADDDVGHSVQLTQDGGYVVAGFTKSFGAGSYDAWLVKFDAMGTVVWSKTYGGALYDWAESVVQTEDGGYVLVGRTYSLGAGDADAWLVRTDANGDTLWTRTFGGAGFDQGFSVCQAQDGGFTFTGRTASYGAGGTDVWLVHTDPAGNELWNRTYGGVYDDNGYSVWQTRDGNYLVVGSTFSGVLKFDVLLVKADVYGNEVWRRTYTYSDDDYGMSVREAYDGGYVFVGVTGSGGASSSQVWLVKTDDAGNKTWNRWFGGNRDYLGNSLDLTQDGGYVIAGMADYHGSGSGEVLLVKTTSDGDEVWTHIYGGNNQDEGYSVARAEDGGYIIAGYTYSFGAGGADLLLIKTDAEGHVDEGPDEVRMQKSETRMQNGPQK